MNLILKRLGAVATAVLLVPGLAACGNSNPSSSVPVAHQDDPIYVDHDGGSQPDCDAEDRRKNETPDCGYYYRGRFYAWSWVSSGRTTPPYGWRGSTEQRATVARVAAATPAPKRTSTTARTSTRPVAPPAAQPAPAAPRVAQVPNRPITRATTRRR